MSIDFSVFLSPCEYPNSETVFREDRCSFAKGRCYRCFDSTLVFSYHFIIFEDQRVEESGDQNAVTKETKIQDTIKKYI